MRDSAFAEFAGDSLPALYRYAYVLTGDAHAAEDLVQETLVKLTGVWRRVRHDGNPIGYARAVMFRTFVSRWRTLKRRPALEAYHHEQPAPGDQYAQLELRDALRRALLTLPRLQRAVLVLGYLDDLADEEIAVLLDRRQATIRSLRFRGLRTLREQLNHDMTEVTHGSH